MATARGTVGANAHNNIGGTGRHPIAAGRGMSSSFPRGRVGVSTNGSRRDSVLNGARSIRSVSGGSYNVIPDRP